MALYASGRTTGIVVDSGYAITHTVPIYEGFALSHAIQKIPLAGRDLTEFLIKLMDDVGRSFSNIPETKRDNARDTKEKKCYVVPDFEAEMKTFAENNKEISHILPDGNEIMCGNQLFKCPEALFTPMKLNKDY